MAGAETGVEMAESFGGETGSAQGVDGGAEDVDAGAGGGVGTGVDWEESGTSG